MTPPFPLPARLLTLWLLLLPCAAPLPAAGPLVFNATAPTNDLEGALEAQVLFAQSQILPSRPRPGDTQPHLTGLRKSLLLVRPLKPAGTTPWVVTARDGRGRTLGTGPLHPPERLPKTAYFVDGAPEGGIDFTPGNGGTGTVRAKAEVERLSDPDGVFLEEQLKQHALVEIRTADGVWVRDIHLPRDPTLEGRMVRVQSEAGYLSKIHYSGREAEISRGGTLVFKCVNGRWFRDGDLENNSITYATDAWSAVLPAEWLVPGLTLHFQQGELTGTLTGLHRSARDAVAHSHNRRGHADDAARGLCLCEGPGGAPRIFPDRAHEPPHRGPIRRAHLAGGDDAHGRAAHGAG